MHAAGTAVPAFIKCYLIIVREQLLRSEPGKSVGLTGEPTHTPI
jgi:hypothetical protein